MNRTPKVKRKTFGVFCMKWFTIIEYKQPFQSLINIKCIWNWKVKYSIHDLSHKEKNHFLYNKQKRVRPLLTYPLFTPLINRPKYYY